MLHNFIITLLVCFCSAQSMVPPHQLNQQNHMQEENLYREFCTFIKPTVEHYLPLYNKEDKEYKFETGKSFLEPQNLQRTRRVLKYFAFMYPDVILQRNEAGESIFVKNHLLKLLQYTKAYEGLSEDISAHRISLLSEIHGVVTTLMKFNSIQIAMKGLVQLEYQRIRQLMPPAYQKERVMPVEYSDPFFSLSGEIIPTVHAILLGYKLQMLDKKAWSSLVIPHKDIVLKTSSGNITDYRMLNLAVNNLIVKRAWDSLNIEITCEDKEIRLFNFMQKIYPRNDFSFEHFKLLCGKKSLDDQGNYEQINNIFKQLFYNKTQQQSNDILVSCAKNGLMELYKEIQFIAIMQNLKDSEKMNAYYRMLKATFRFWEMSHSLALDCYSRYAINFSSAYFEQKTAQITRSLVTEF